MCGVVCASGAYDVKRVKQLFYNSRIRGLHAYGYAFVKQKRLEVRRFLSYVDFVSSFEAEAPRAFIAHLRYSTSGDWLTQSNNQPVERGGIAIAFNGVLDMRTKTEMEQAYQFQFASDNDAEIALNIVSQNNLEPDCSSHPLVDFINEKQRTFAGAFLTQDDRLFVLRNGRRPLWFADDFGAKYVASTADIMNRSGITKHSQVPANHILEL